MNERTNRRRKKQFILLVSHRRKVEHDQAIKNYIQYKIVENSRLVEKFPRKCH